MAGQAVHDEGGKANRGRGLGIRDAFKGLMNTIVRSLMLALAVSVGVPACYVEEDVPLYMEGYQPQFYDGYVVYYDSVGRPFYYEGGTAYWVPATSPLYVGLVNHWNVYGQAYGRWYSHYGYRYRAYRGRR
jgi:hypothetical protein